MKYALRVYLFLERGAVLVLMAHGFLFQQTEHGRKPNPLETAGVLVKLFLKYAGRQTK
jgi:hypothetical protein